MQGWAFRSLKEYSEFAGQTSWYGQSLQSQISAESSHFLWETLEPSGQIRFIVTSADTVLSIEQHSHSLMKAFRSGSSAGLQKTTPASQNCIGSNP